MTELRGLARENGVDFETTGPDGVKFLRVEGAESTSELMDRSRGERIQYYQQTASAYFEALGRAEIDSHLCVAEIGAERTLWKLRVIEDLCDQAFGVNIFFHVPETAPPPTAAMRVLGDMNELPFVSNSLDLLIYSATLHHSVDIPNSLKEAARVLRSGGQRDCHQRTGRWHWQGARWCGRARPRRRNSRRRSFVSGMAAGDQNVSPSTGSLCSRVVSPPAT